MKKIVLLLALCLSAGHMFAQDADKFREAGDAALKAKDYANVVTNCSKYLEATNYQDTVRIYNCGFAATQAKKPAEAAKFFDMAIKYKYNIDDAYLGKAMALRDQNKAAEFTATVEEGMKAIPENNPKRGNLEKLLYVYCIKSGQAAQKAGKYDQAEELFKDVLTVSNKKYKTNALYSAGVMYYNKAAKALQEATPLATSEPDKYKTAKAAADADMAKAKDFIQQALAITPGDANSKKILDAINATK